MDRQDIVQLIALLEQSSLNVLELQQGDFRIRLEKPAGALFGGSAEAGSIGLIPSAPAQPAPVVDIPAVQPVTAAGTPTPEAGTKSIKAPMVGIYHDAPEGHVKAGAALKKGAVVCIIEAMKLMNEIVMEEDGVIAWSALKDGDMVEYDQLLFTYN